MRALSDNSRSFLGEDADQGVGDLLARLADGFARGTYDGASHVRIEIERIGGQRAVRVRMWSDT